MDAVHIQDAQQQVAGCHGLAFVRDMAVAFQLSVGAADQDVRHVVVLVLVRVAHVGAVQNQRVIQQRAVAVRNRPQLLAKYAERRHVIAVESRVSLDLRRIVLMMRSAVEADAGAAVRGRARSSGTDSVGRSGRGRRAASPRA